MKIFIVTIIILLIWGMQVMVSALIHASRPSRIPHNMFDFLKLTFLPYVLYCLIFNKKSLD